MYSPVSRWEWTSVSIAAAPDVYPFDFHVGRYVSLERLIEQNKDRYYETLEESSSGWHEHKHDPWPFVNYLLFILKQAYREFEERVGQLSSPRGHKDRNDNRRYRSPPATLVSLKSRDSALEWVWI